MYPAFQSSDKPFERFPARRSAVHSTKGMVACSQPLAAQAGQTILGLGGNAADAAVAVAAALNVTEPASTGLGGDAFFLFYNAATKTVHALNASGRSAKNTTLKQVREELGLAKGKVPFTSPLAVTVPGAAAGWVDAVERFGSGRLTLEQVLTPAIDLCERGFPVSEISASMWKNGESKLKGASPYGVELLKPNGKAPESGEVFRNPHLGKTLRTLATESKKGIYTGRIAKAIVDVLQQKGAHLELSDLEDYASQGYSEVVPVSLQFRGQGVGSRGSSTSKDQFVELWEHPPNGQGIVALMALGILEELEKSKQIPTFKKEDHNTAVYIHAVAEAFRIAFADVNWWVTDPEHSPVKPEELVSRPYLAERAKLFNKEKAGNHAKGQQFGGVSPAQNRSDTVVFAVVDQDGNGMSVVNSNFMEFGSGIVPQGCGFTLQNRGAGFHLGPDNHPNIYRGGKRPYHTIIPCLATQGPDRDLHSVFGVMGGLMQPQGHVQVLLNMEVFGMTPQEAVDAPRLCIENPMSPKLDSIGSLFLEEGIDKSVATTLQAMGHDVQVLKGWSRNRFGRGQAIKVRTDETGQRVLTGGSDGRGDGLALPA
ncbi:gamma-glutamyltransferase [Cladophialophora bantiana CBS 173.52]|uniref:Gamma-glutamyltransferase n=1 Tax=Cladophialophora bantiana (strain ATCC 10958 / CBS 173.52 / CDC B-1940 / NIH 8579) TaxID=1442370 RepID=A0A0D2F4R2_CLAB1|nr:gamma-glutamyltransferase [Cladophialophora bantiana CBS 173.52]KIW97226.1 gamma-glutamyltransferase [Cladophialophora bantiana CBS 173.52]